MTGEFTEVFFSKFEHLLSGDSRGSRVLLKFSSVKSGSFAGEAPMTDEFTEVSFSKTGRYCRAVLAASRIY
jgi:hypothetical protein